jgi:hypothetical protein
VRHDVGTGPGRGQLEGDGGTFYRPIPRVRYFDHQRLRQRLAHMAALAVTSYHIDRGRLTLAGKKKAIPSAAGSQEQTPQRKAPASPGMGTGAYGMAGARPAERREKGLEHGKDGHRFRLSTTPPRRRIS